MMKKILVLFFILLFLGTSANAYDYTYYLGIKGGLSKLSSRPLDSLKYPFQTSFGGTFGYRFQRHWIVEFEYSHFTIYNDSTKNSTFSIGADKTNATEKWDGDRYGILLHKYLSNPDSRTCFILGAGGGLLNWQVRDPEVDSIYNVEGLHNEMVDYKASELFFTGLLGVDFNLSRKWIFSTDLQADYLTGAGEEFSSLVKANRNKWQVSLQFSLKLLFGGFKETEWTSDESWRQPEPVVVRKRSGGVDSDGDGVLDDDDSCPDTPSGAVVNKNGCPVDSDFDGIPDGLDHCPATDRKAAGMVDINGCPIDSDFDGIADYEDNCPDNPKGARVDQYGCPIDTDGDGVPDGLDDCPNTLYGVDVDKNGCIDLSVLSKPLVLNINYPPGSFEVDPNNRERLKALSRILNFVKDIKLEINGYTDNIGTTVANKNLSEKRARRVRDFLVTQGIAAERMKVFGKGETNFVADNSTAAGREKNRRIEIIFYK